MTTSDDPSTTTPADHARRHQGDETAPIPPVTAPAEVGPLRAGWDLQMVLIERSRQWWWNAWRSTTSTELEGLAASRDLARRDMHAAVDAAEAQPTDALDARRDARSAGGRHTAGAPGRPHPRPGPQFAPGEEEVAIRWQDPHAGAPATQVVTPPPMVWDASMQESVTLLQWVRERHYADVEIWPTIVAEFYGTAAADPEIAEYFAPVLARPDGMVDLQRHFLRALKIVCDTGLTVGALRAMEAKHAGVRNGAGAPISHAICDRVIAALVGVLRKHGVPADGIASLAITVGPLRDAIAVG